MSWDLGSRKRAEALAHVDLVNETLIRDLAFRSHHINASAKAIYAFRRLSNLESERSLGGVLDAMKAFSRLLNSDPDEEVEDGESEDIPAICYLYVIKATVIVQQLFVDSLAQIFCTIQDHKQYWSYEAKHPWHYIITSIPYRIRMLHTLITDEKTAIPLAATPSFYRASMSPNANTSLSMIALDDDGGPDDLVVEKTPRTMWSRIQRAIKRSLKFCHLTTFKQNLIKWIRALSNPYQMQYFFKQTFSDPVRKNLMILRRRERLVVEQLGFTYSMLSATTSINDEDELYTHVHTSLDNMTTFLKDGYDELSRTGDSVLSRSCSQSEGHPGFKMGQSFASPLSPVTLPIPYMKSDSLHENGNGKPSIRAMNPRTDLEQLITLGNLAKKYMKSITYKSYYETRPSKTRHWHKGLIYGYAGFRIILGLRGLLTKGIQPVLLGIAGTVQAYLNCYVMEPLQGIVSLLSRGEDAMKHLGSESLTSETKTLENMVLDYHKDMGHPKWSASKEAEVRKQLQEGDLSSINDVYESYIKNPVSSLLFKDMTRLLFIQMQQQKVNISRVYTTMDDMMRMMELNVHIMAAMPAFMFVAFCIYLWRSRRDLSISPHRTAFVSQLREVEVILNRCTDVSLDWFQQGHLLLKVNDMRVMAPKITRNPDRQVWLKEDLADLENDSLSVASRLSTVHRLIRTQNLYAMRSSE